MNVYDLKLAPQEGRCSRYFKWYLSSPPWWHPGTKVEQRIPISMQGLRMHHINRPQYAVEMHPSCFYSAMMRIRQGLQPESFSTGGQFMVLMGSYSDGARHFRSIHSSILTGRGSTLIFASGKFMCNPLMPKSCIEGHIVDWSLAILACAAHIRSDLWFLDMFGMFQKKCGSAKSDAPKKIQHNRPVDAFVSEKSNPIRVNCGYLSTSRSHEPSLRGDTLQLQNFLGCSEDSQLLVYLMRSPQIHINIYKLSLPQQEQFNLSLGPLSPSASCL